LANLDIDQKKQHKNRRLFKLRRSFTKFRYNFIADIPGTSQFKFRYAKVVIKLVKINLAIYNKITTIPPEYKNKYYKQFKENEITLAKISIYSSLIREYIFILSILLSFIFAIISAFIVVNLFNFNLSYKFNIFPFRILNIYLFSDISIGLIFSGFIVIILPSFIFFIYPNIRLIGTILLILPAITFFIGLIILNYLYSLTHGSATNSNVQNLIISLQSGVILTFFIFVCFWAIFFTDVMEVLLKRRRDPVELIVDNLISIIGSAEIHINSWQELDDKQNELLKLEEIAKCIEHYLPRRLRSNDVTTDIWLKIITMEVATYIREKKRWILIPKSDTNIHLTNELVYMLICVCDGNWDGLKRMKPEELKHDLPAPQFLRSRVIGVLKIVLVAILPSIGFLIVQLTPWHINEPIREYVIIGLFIWGFLAFISALDPTFSTKISAIKDITSIFPFGKDSKS
jgi:hypothetical protein